MLQFPDFEEKQTLFIESFETKNISFENENLVIKEDWDIKNKVSLYKIFTIFLIGETTLTSVIIRKFQDFPTKMIFFLPWDPTLLYSHKKAMGFIQLCFWVMLSIQ